MKKVYVFWGRLRGAKDRKSQAASLLNSLATKTVPPCGLGLLAAMVACGLPACPFSLGTA